MVSLERVPLLTVTVMLTSWGVAGVCHLTQTSWQSSYGMTILFAW